MTTLTTNRVISYFFVVDFYHLKGSSDALDLLSESIVYFYPPKEDIKKQVFNKSVWKKNDQMLFNFAHEIFFENHFNLI